MNVNIKYLQRKACRDVALIVDTENFNQITAE